MDEETLWVLKMLAEKRISAQKADRLLRALELLKESEEGKVDTPESVEIKSDETAQEQIIEEIKEDVESEQDSALEIAENPDEILETSSEEIDISQEQENITHKDFEDEQLEEVSTEKFEEAQEQIEENITEIAVDNHVILIEKENLEDEKEEPIIAEKRYPVENSQTDTEDENDRNAVILEIANDSEIIFNNENSNLTIHGWDQDQLKFEGHKKHVNIFQEDNRFNIDIDNNGEFTFYIPLSVTKIRLFSASGKMNIQNHDCDMFISNGSGDIYVRDSMGSLKAKTIGGNIAVEDYKGNTRLQSETGSILARRIGDNEEADKSINLMTQTDKDDSSRALEINVQTESGDISLEDVIGLIDVKGNGEIIRLSGCKGQNISVESKGAKVNLKDIATSISLKAEGGEVAIEDFFGNVKIEAKETPILLTKSGDAQIYINSDGGGINIEDCYADVNVNSEKGDIYIAGGNLSFAAMGKIELRMKNGNAYLDRRTFENILISIENGNAEVSMEKLNSGGFGNISTHKGDIKFQVSPKFQFDLMAQASKKKIHLELPIEITEKEKNYLRGTLNNGGAKINLVAPEGEIFVQALTD